MELPQSRPLRTQGKLQTQQLCYTIKTIPVIFLLESTSFNFICAHCFSRNSKVVWALTMSHIKN